MTQKAKLLTYLQRHGSVTQMEAFSILGICRLSERVREIEQLGWTIAHTRTEVPTRTGKPAHVVRYSIVREPKRVMA